MLRKPGEYIVSISRHCTFAEERIGPTAGVVILEIKDRPVHVAEMFHTYMRAVGLDPAGAHRVGGNNVPVGAPERSAVKELLA